MTFRQGGTQTAEILSKRASSILWHRWTILKIGGSLHVSESNLRYGGVNLDHTLKRIDRALTVIESKLGLT